MKKFKIIYWTAVVIFIIISALLLSSCQKQDDSPFKDVRMEDVTPTTPTTSTQPFQVIEFDTAGAGIATYNRGFSVSFQGDKILSGIFTQNDNGSVDYKVRSAWIKLDPETGLNVWAVYVISCPRYVAKFMLVREDGALIRKDVKHTNNTGQSYLMMQVKYDGLFIISLESSQDGHQETVYINFD